MSYLTLAQPIGVLNKAVISFWFRVPKESAAGAIEMALDFAQYKALHGVIPLITWGPQPLAKTGLVVPIYQGGVTVGGGPITLEELVLGPPSIPMGPSYIGLYVGTKDDPRDDPTLDVNIQTKDFTTGTNVFNIKTSWTGTDTGLTYDNPFDPDNPHTGDPIFIDVEYGYTDVTNEIYAGGPDNFGASGSLQDTAKVSFDKWHHLLISWDLDGRKMWCALDDVNLTGQALPAHNDPTLGDGPNQSWSQNEFAVQGEEGKFATLSVSTIPTNPVNLPGPGSIDYVDNDLAHHVKKPVLTVEMAELQIFCGITLDTEKSKNRRVFISSDGKPVSPSKKANPADSKSTSGSIEFFKRKPDIMLHGSGNWIKGNNTGSTGVDQQGKPIPKWQFIPTAKIEHYTPDPSLKPIT